MAMPPRFHNASAHLSTILWSALARKLLVLVYYALRDGQVRCLAQAQKAG
jgi:hypothetical protein